MTDLEYYHLAFIEHATYEIVCKHTIAYIIDIGEVFYLVLGTCAIYYDPPKPL